MIMKNLLKFLLGLFLTSCCGPPKCPVIPSDSSNPIQYATAQMDQTHAGKYIYQSILAKYPPGSNPIELEQYLKSLGGVCGDITIHDHGPSRICHFVGYQLARIPSCECVSISTDWYVNILIKGGKYYDIDLIMTDNTLGVYIDTGKLPFDFKHD